MLIGMLASLWRAPWLVSLLPVFAILLQWALPELQLLLMAGIGGEADTARAFAFKLLPISMALAVGVVWATRWLFGRHHRIVLLLLALQATALMVRQLNDRWGAATDHGELLLFCFAGLGVFALVYLLCVVHGGGLHEVRRTASAVFAHVGIARRYASAGRWVHCAKLLALGGLGGLAVLFVASDGNGQVEMACHFFAYYLFLLVLPLAPLVAHHRLTLARAAGGGRITGGWLLGAAGAVVAFCLLSAPAAFYAFVAWL